MQYTHEVGDLEVAHCACERSETALWVKMVTNQYTHEVGA
ncbi:hypothetical protein SCG7109_AL_00250 [Chlamydiales bacterium SCGC AG-110-M15]|nr:hypothetical protein SCG7109_AL_00250 [Chlamydiales bacterium SCGC AG-110-M15]